MDQSIVSPFLTHGVEYSYYGRRTIGYSVDVVAGGELGKGVHLSSRPKDLGNVIQVSQEYKT